MAYNKQIAQKFIIDVIDRGFSLLKKEYFSDELLKQWVDYSIKVLELTTQDYKPAILLNYYTLLSNSQMNNVGAAQKMLAYLRYLIDVLKVL